MRSNNFLTLIPALMPAPDGRAADQSRLQVSEQSFSFEIFDPAEPVEHVFYFHNSGADTIQVERIALTPPLRVGKILSRIPPNEDGQLIVGLGTPRELGEYEGAIEVSFKNKDLSPVRLEFTGKITPVIEVRPVPAFFIATTRGRTNSASLEIVNKDVEPMEESAIWPRALTDAEVAALGR